MAGFYLHTEPLANSASSLTRWLFKSVSRESLDTQHGAP